MQLQQYLKLINYQGVLEPTLEVLCDLHRCHAYNISYENIDVVMQTPVSLDAAAIFEKIVGNGRGGWCYEMNGLLGWALQEIGFTVTRYAGGVMRSERGDQALGNHLVLRIDLDEPWIADVGLGDGIVEPLPLRMGEYRQGHRCFQLRRLDSGGWRFRNRPDGMPPDYDFFEDSTSEHQLRATCESLQSDPESMFRQNLICQRISDTGGYSLLGRILINLDDGGRRMLHSEVELIDVLTNVFFLKLPDITGLWNMVVDRHQVLFANKPVDDIQFGPTE